MTALLATALGLPLLGALVVAVGAVADRTRGARTTAATIAGLTAAAWAVLAAADPPTELGRVVADPLAAAAAVGLALLVAAHLPARPVAASGALCSISVFAVGATTGASAGADRPLGAAVVALVALVLVQARVERVRSASLLALGAGGAVVAAGLLLDPTATVAAVVVLGGGAVLLATMWCPTAVLLAPAVALAIVRTLPEPPPLASGPPAPGTSGAAVAGLLVAAAALGALIAVTNARSGRSSVAPAVSMPDQNVRAGRVGRLVWGHGRGRVWGRGRRCWRGRPCSPRTWASSAPPGCCWWPAGYWPP